MVRNLMVSVTGVEVKTLSIVRTLPYSAHDNAEVRLCRLSRIRKSWLACLLRKPCHNESTEAAMNASFATRWNLGAIEDAHQRWREDPGSVDEQWRAFFEGFELAGRSPVQVDTSAQLAIY